MVLVVILVLLVVASVLFHIFSPWHATPIASNWGSIDSTITITVVITGVFFVAITLFMAYAVYRFRHKDDPQQQQRADYEPENRKLEWILITVTTVGICALLAPGLFVYGDFVRVPDNARQLEAVGQQWRWTFRLPGEDGELGASAIGYIDGDNPFGIDPDDPAGQDDILIDSNQVHIPIGQPVKMLLRSKDVLHDLYVPQFRVKMDSVPGLVTYMWFTPTRLGEFEILCSELCGVGHYNMRGKVVVETPEDYQHWLQQQPTFAESLVQNLSGGLVEQGRKLAQGQGCVACHSLDGSKSIGPTWHNAYGATRTLVDGTTVVVDEAYLRESITNPNAKMVKDYPPVMVVQPLSDEQLDALVAYIQSLTVASPESVESTPGTPLETSVDPPLTAPPEAPQEPQQVVAEPDAQAVPQALGEETVVDLVALGRNLATAKGCQACHSVDGSKILGPSWKGMWGSTTTLVDDSTVVVGEAYFRESIVNPNAKLVKGYPPVMPPMPLSEDEIQALMAYARSMGSSESEAEETK